MISFATKLSNTTFTEKITTKPQTYNELLKTTRVGF